MTNATGPRATGSDERASDELLIEYEFGDVDLLQVVVRPRPGDELEFKRELGRQLINAQPGSPAKQRADWVIEFGRQRGYRGTSLSEDKAGRQRSVTLERHVPHGSLY